MILSTIEHAKRYHAIHPAFEQAFDFLLRNNLNELEPGNQVLDGDLLFCSISKKGGRRREEVKLEAHRKYIDIQYLINGSEVMGWSPTADCHRVCKEYALEKDIEFFDDTPVSWINVSSGSFVIFFPEDAHAPMVGDSEIHKVVIKIMLEQ